MDMGKIARMYQAFIWRLVRSPIVKKYLESDEVGPPYVYTYIYVHVVHSVRSCTGLCDDRGLTLPLHNTHHPHTNGNKKLGHGAAAPQAQGVLRERQQGPSRVLM